MEYIKKLVPLSIIRYDKKMYRFKKNEKKMNVRSLPVIFRLFSDTGSPCAKFILHPVSLC